MYTIGEVSKIVNISPNALRYYDEIGLLRPCLIQSTNQYRYYSDDQIKEIIFILELKQYGFSLEEIKLLLQDRSDSKLKSMLEEKSTRLYSEIAVLRDRYTLLEKRIAEINKEEVLKMKGGKILIVDDLALTRLMIRTIVEAYGHTVVGEASDGEQAITAYEELRPDLVIMDITMPKMDGIYASSLIKQKHRNAKIIMCSAMSQPIIILESIAAGASDFITKPLSSLRLIQAVERTLNDNHYFNLVRIAYVTELIKQRWNQTVYSRQLKQDEIDQFLDKTINDTKQDEDIHNFFATLNLDDIIIDKSDMSGPSPINENVISFLADKSATFSKGLSSYMSKRFNQEYTINPTTVENITASEFHTLINDSDNIGILECSISNSPICVHVSGELQNKEEVLNEILDFAAEDFKILLPIFCTKSLVKSSGDHKKDGENYSTVLISFSIELDIDEKGFIMVSLPHKQLKYLPV